MKLYDTDGNGPLIDPEEADYFYGVNGDDTVMVKVDDPTLTSYGKASVYKSAHIGNYDFRKLYTKIKKIVINQGFTISVRNVGKKFTPVDFSELPKKKKIEEKYDIAGTKKTSYHSNGKAKVVVKHNHEVNEEKFNSRSRDIKYVFVKNGLGEQRKVPNLAIGKAVATHVNNGGELYDPLVNDFIEVYEILCELLSSVEQEDVKIFLTNKKKDFSRRANSYSKRKSQLPAMLVANDDPKYIYSKTFFGDMVDEEIAEKLAHISMKV